MMVFAFAPWERNLKHALFIMKYTLSYEHALRFRVAMISIRLNNAIPLTYSLAEQISNSLRYVSMDINF